MTRPLAYDRKEIAIEKALNDSDDLMDLDGMVKVARDFLDSLNRWNERNRYNPHLQLEEAPGCVEYALDEITALRERQAERVENDATEEFLRRRVR